MFLQTSIGVAIAVLLTLATGCQPDAKVEGDRPDLPKLGELAPDTDPTQEVPSIAGQLVAQRLMFDRDDARIDLALIALDAPPLPGPTLAAWQANGFRIGMIERQRLDLFLANLPRTRGLRSTVFNPAPNYTPMVLVGRVPNGHVARVADGPGPPKARQFIGGQYQFLIKLNPSLDAEQTMNVEIIPHHFGPRDSILPRTPAEKMLDGTLFDAMRINQPLTDGQVWVIWGDIDRDALRRRGVDRSRLNDPDAPPPTIEQIARDQVAGTPPPPLLGEAMTTGLRGNRPIRVVILLQAR